MIVVGKAVKNWIAHPGRSFIPCRSLTCEAGFLG